MKKLVPVMMICAMLAMMNCQAAESSTENQISDAKIRQDVLNRFDKVYQEKKKLYDQAQLQLTVAQQELTTCGQLSGEAKDNCIVNAKAGMESLSMRLKALQYDMDLINKEVQGITAAH